MLPTTNKIAKYQVHALTIEVIPSQKFMDWIRSLEEHADQTETDLQPFDSNIYLLPFANTQTEVQEIVCSHAEFIFASECMDWSMDPIDWPPFETQSSLDDWFTVKIHSTISDLRDMAQQSAESDAASPRRLA